MRRLRCSLLVALAALLLAACGDTDNGQALDDIIGDGPSAAEDDVEDAPSEPDEDAPAALDIDRMTLLVPTPPGSSFDTWSRGIAPYLADELGVQVIVDNRPGASGLVALNDMAQTDPDGSTLVLWQGGPLAIADIQGVEEVRFDLRELANLGNYADADHMLFVSQESEYETFEDVVEAGGFAFASGERGSLGFTSQQVLDELFGLEANFITGYDDQGERLTAIERGDADGVIGPVRTIESIGRLGDVRPLLRLANQPSPEFPDVATALDLDLDAEAREIMETHMGMSSLFFTMMGPPGMDDGTLQTLRDAFWNVANSQEFLADLEGRGLVISPETEYLTGEEVEELIPSLLDVPERYRQILEEIAAG
jgi:tripartite-type tricarboxylate transporter receptor subunit TctC